MWRESVRDGWGVFVRHPVPFLLATLIYGLAASALAGASRYALGQLGSAAVLVLLGPCLGGLTLMVEQVRAGEQPDLNVAFAPWQRAGDYLVVGLAIACGVLVLGVGVLATFTLFLFAPVMAAEGVSYSEALARSRDLVVTHWQQVIPIAAGMVAASAVSMALTYSLGLLVVLPVGVASTCYLLERLRGLPDGGRVVDRVA